jgi:hypothetical protein
MRRSYNGLAGSETLLACGHQSERKVWYGSSLDLLLFRLVVCSLQVGVVGPYLARGE